MKRIILATLIAALAVPTAAMAARVKPQPGNNGDVRYKSERREPAPRGEYRPRQVVRERAVLRPGFPIHREPVRVVVRRQPMPVERRVVYVSAPIIWRGVILAGLPYDHWAWHDSEVLHKWEGWTDVVLDVNQRGNSLYLELSGPTQLDFAEIVFSDGRAQTVDFRQRTHWQGAYELMDFRHDRRVDYVRLVARAMAPSVRVSVDMAG
jgi:hypothetical protein